MMGCGRGTGTSRAASQALSLSDGVDRLSVQTPKSALQQIGPAFSLFGVYCGASGPGC